MSEKTSRRGYVKYAAAGVVVIAGAAAGAYYATRPPAPSPTPTPTKPTPTPTEKPTATPTPTAGRTTVRNLHHWGGHWLRPPMDHLKEKFHEVHPEVKMEVIETDWGDLYPKYLSMLNAGDPPEVVNEGPTLFMDYSESFYDMGPLIDEIPGLREDIIPGWSSIIDDSLGEGRYTGVPNITVPVVIAYNKNVYEMAGLDPEKPPDTLDKMWDAAYTINAADKKIAGINMPTNVGMVGPVWTYTVVEQFWQWNGTQVFKEYGIPESGVILEDKRNIEVLEKLRQVHDDGVAFRGLNLDDTREAMMTGKAGHSFDGSYIAVVQRILFPDLEYPKYWDILPSIDPVVGAENHVNGIPIIFKDKKDVIDAAWKWIKWFSFSEYAQEYICLEMGGYGTTLKSNLTNPDFKANLLQNKVTGLLETGRIYEMPLKFFQMVSFLVPEITAVLLENKDPELAMADAAMMIRRLYGLG